MKKYVLVFLFSIISIPLFSQNSELEKEKQILLAKDKVFYSLKNFHNKSISEYYSIFITIEEIRNLGKSKKFNINEEKRKKLTTFPKFEYTNKIRRELNEILTTSEKLNLDFEKIVFYDFIYKEIKTNSGIEKYECLLMFEEEGENDMYFSVEIQLYNTENGIKIVEIDDLVGAPKEEWEKLQKKNNFKIMTTANK